MKYEIFIISIGVVTIPGGMTFALDSDNQFTLTCISTGGPATTVTWTRGNDNITEGTETVLDDPETAQYTHTLIVNERVGGLYTCTVANRVSNERSAELNVTGKSVSGIISIKLHVYYHLTHQPPLHPLM